MQDLLPRWRRLLPDTTDSVEIGRDLLARYSAPERRYHDVRHLREVLDAVDLLASYASDVGCVRLAAWFHDAICQGRPEADEHASAELAERALGGCGVEPDRVAEVGRLVRLTARHHPAEDDRNGAVLCDADLAILGSTPGRYAEYAAAVRAEYAHVSDEEFRFGRLAVLERLLARDPLYRTPEARERWAAAARRNISEEVRALRAR